jgi:hypothetical protein
MSEPGPTQDNGESKKARKRREEHELREKRSRQLSDARAALATLNRKLESAISAVKQIKIIADHSHGFYVEIDKLAKGKALIEATDLAVKQVNEIIRDAKSVVKKDLYLDRIKEFVPAGDNPVYPDILISTRSVRDSLERGRKGLEEDTKTLQQSVRRAETVVGALEYFLDDEAEGDKQFPTESEIEPYVSGLVSKSCFTESPDLDEEYFDFEDLDSQTMEEYLSIAGGEAASESLTQDDDETKELLGEDSEEGEENV